MTILNEIIEYKKTLLERKYYDKKIEIQDRYDAIENIFNMI